VLFDGRMWALDEGRAYAARRRMGMLFQFGALFTDLSVFDNVAFPLREHTDLPKRLMRDIVLMKLNAVGLRGARDLMPSEISGGMAGGWRWRAPSRWTRSSSCTTSRLPGWTRFRWARRRA
jgi:phospholipid/cholesterol/gamma-HCH transport system ATP-binding protein